MNKDNNPFPDFWLHVANAHNAGEDVDNYDPDGTEKGSEELNRLVGVSNEAAVVLIEYVVEHKDLLLEKLKGEA